MPFFIRGKFEFLISVRFLAFTVCPFLFSYFLILKIPLNVFMDCFLTKTEILLSLNGHSISFTLSLLLEFQIAQTIL